MKYFNRYKDIFLPLSDKLIYLSKQEFDISTLFYLLHEQLCACSCVAEEEGNRELERKFNETMSLDDVDSQQQLSGKC